MNRDFGHLRYDVIIDDGLHSVAANLNTLLFGLTVLNENGWIIIEDIFTHRICWNTIYRLLPESKFDIYIVDCNGPSVFLLRKRELKS